MLVIRAPSIGADGPRLRWRLCTVIAVAVSVSSCLRASPPAQPKTNLVVGTALPPVVTPDTGVGSVIRSLTLEAPIAIAWDGRAVGRAFDTWTWLPHRRGLRLHVRPSLFFHDGTPLTNSIAADIVRSYFSNPRNMTSAVVASVEPEGDSDIVITTAKPEGFLLSDLSTINFSLPGKPRVGTGPFKYDAGPPTHLERFDRYHLGIPQIDRIEIKDYPSQRAAWGAMMRDEIDMLHNVNMEAVEFLEAETSVVTHSFTRPYYLAAALNLKHPALRLREVRRALNEGIDREAIVRTAMRGLGTPAFGPVWPFHWAFSATQPKYPFDPDSAKRRLDAAGFPVHDAADKSRMPSRFTLHCLTVAEDRLLERIALVLQKQLFDLGVDLSIEQVPLQKMQERAGAGTFDAILTELIGSRSLNWVARFWHSSEAGRPRLLDTGYAASDAALDRLRYATDDPEIRAAVADLQRSMHDEPPAIFLAWGQTSRALSRAFSVPNEGARDIMSTIRRWSPAPARQARR